MPAQQWVDEAALRRRLLLGYPHTPVQVDDTGRLLLATLLVLLLLWFVFCFEEHLQRLLVGQVESSLRLVFLSQDLLHLCLGYLKASARCVVLEVIVHFACPDPAVWQPGIKCRGRLLEMTKMAERLVRVPLVVGTSACSRGIPVGLVQAGGDVLHRTVLKITGSQPHGDCFVL